ncbi:MAG TPA: hypothetical protein VIN10_05450 [Bacteroidales bacterium]
MDRIFIRFIKQISALAILLIVASLLILRFVPAIPITPSFLYIIIFIYAFTVLVFKMLLKGQQDKLSRFVNLYLLVNFGKLVIYITIIFIYAYLNRADAVPFILTFFVYYFAFTIFEIASLLQIKK